MTARKRELNTNEVGGNFQYPPVLRTRQETFCARDVVVSQRQARGDGCNVLKILQQLHISQFHPIRNNNLHPISARPSSIFDLLLDIAGIVSATSNLDGDSAGRYNFQHDVYYQSELGKVQHVEFPGAACCVDAMYFGGAEALQIFAKRCLVQRIIFVPGKSHPGPDSLKRLSSQTWFSHFNSPNCYLLRNLSL